MIRLMKAIAWLSVLVLLGCEVADELDEDELPTPVEEETAAEDPNWPEDWPEDGASLIDLEAVHEQAISCDSTGNGVLLAPEPCMYYSCKASATNYCCGSCMNPVPPPPTPDPSAAVVCCACSTPTGGCGSLGYCINADRLGVFDPCPGGTFCTHCRDIDEDEPDYDVHGHNAGPDAECGTEDDTYYRPPGDWD